MALKFELSIATLHSWQSSLKELALDPSLAPTPSSLSNLFAQAHRLSHFSLVLEETLPKFRFLSICLLLLKKQERNIEM